MNGGLPMSDQRYVVNPLVYLSPSSFLEWKRCPELFFLRRLSGHVGIKSRQGIPAAMGSAFDTYIKRYIANKLGLQDRPDLLLHNLITQVDYDGDERDEILESGHNLATKYVSLGFVDRLLREGVYDVNLHLYKSFGNFAILGKPDAAIKTDSFLIPCDWKIRGYKSKTGYSPTPGYKVYVTSDGKSQAMHQRHLEPLENLNHDWAVQTVIYTWLLNNIIITDMDLPVAIDEITFGANNIIFTQIRTYVSAGFSNQVLVELLKCWDECKNPPNQVYEDRKCNKYNMVCDCSPYCYAYRDFEKEKDLRVMMR